MANTKIDGDGGDSFLGGGPKFNQAGNNAPMPGEKVADAAPPKPFGGPRVWTGIAVVLVLVVVLWFVLGDQLHGVQHVGGRGGIDATSKPGLDPDKPDSSTSQ